MDVGELAPKSYDLTLNGINTEICAFLVRNQP